MFLTNNGVRFHSPVIFFPIPWTISGLQSFLQRKRSKNRQTTKPLISGYSSDLHIARVEIFTNPESNTVMISFVNIRKQVYSNPLFFIPCFRKYLLFLHHGKYIWKLKACFPTLQLSHMCTRDLSASMQGTFRSVNMDSIAWNILYLSCYSHFLDICYLHAGPYFAWICIIQVTSWYIPNPCYDSCFMCDHISYSVSIVRMHVDTHRDNT